MSALAKPAAQAAHVVNLADTLSAVVEELERVRVLALRVEHAICAITTQSGDIDDAFVTELQHLDAALQHVTVLRDFVEQISIRCDDQAEVDIAEALQRISLADVRARLSRSEVLSSEGGWEIL